MKLIPKHIAIIMDGNGRWAKKRNKSRLDGHMSGVKAVKKIVKECVKLDVKFLTLYTFSSENWSRPKSEIIGLLKLLVTTLEEEQRLLIDNNVKFNVFGNLKKLDLFTRNKLKKVEKTTCKNSKLNLNLAISYSGRDEILYAINKILDQKIKSIDKESIFNNYLYTHKFPAPDLLIRTGGELRISNFLLWQIAYSELYFTETLWPDFDEDSLKLALKDFNNRERRFGKISEQINN